MSDQHHITLEIEGTASEDGHVRLSHLLNKLSALATALNGIDRMVSSTGQPTLDYRVVDLGHSSPAYVTLEPIVKENVLKKAKQPAEAYIDTRFNRIFDELDLIRKRQVSPEMDQTTLLSIETIVEGLGRQMKAATIKNHSRVVRLDSEFQRSVSILTQEDASYGGYEGTLDAVNIHGGAKTFWIFPKIGPNKVRCNFLPGTQGEVKEALGHHIRVVGIKYFRSGSPYPHRISAQSFEVLDEDLEEYHLTDMRGIGSGLPGGMTSVEFVRAIRDEWD